MNANAKQKGVHINIQWKKCQFVLYHIFKGYNKRIWIYERI